MNIKLVVFDLGNTLVDYHRGPLTDAEKDLVGLHRMHSVLSKRYRQLSFVTLYEAFYRPWLRAQAHRPKKKSEYDVRMFLRKAVDLSTLDDRTYRRAMLCFHSPYIEALCVAPGAQDFLANLRRMGVRLSLLANSPLPGFCHEAALDRAGLRPLLDLRLFSYDVGRRKPDPSLLQILMERAGAEPSSTVVVGDSDRLDLAPARSLGIRAFRYDCRLQPVASVSATSGELPTLSALSDLAMELSL